MKKILFLSILTLSVFGLNAQQFYFGGAYTGKSTWLLNKAVFDRGAAQDIGASFGGDYGIVGGLSFNDGGSGIEINFLFNNFSQKYVGTDDLAAGITSDYKSKSTFHSVDVPILFKTGSEGAYFEIGPVLSFINSATFEMDYDNALLNDYTENNVDSYNGTNFGAIMGFGGNIFLTDNKALRLTLGLRFYYGFTDIGGVNAYGWDKKETADHDAAYNLLDPTEDDHWGHNEFKTNPVSGGLRIGLIYVVGE